MTTTNDRTEPRASVDPIAALEEQHRMAEALLDQLAEATGGERGPLVEELAAALIEHMRIEEDIIYPIVARAVGEEEAEEAVVEHELARTGLRELQALAPDSPGVDAAVEMLRAGIRHHVEEEESEVFPRLRQLDDESFRSMAEAYAAAVGAAGSAADASDLESLTRDELMERARALDVAGRSAMTKGDLVRALRRA